MSGERMGALGPTLHPESHVPLSPGCSSTSCIISFTIHPTGRCRCFLESWELSQQTMEPAEREAGPGVRSAGGVETCEGDLKRALHSKGLCRLQLV